MSNRDTSSVFHKAMLDEKHQANFPDAKPWIFQTEDDLLTFETADAACEAQRNHRSKAGFDPITGKERLPNGLGGWSDSVIRCSCQ